MKYIATALTALVLSVPAQAALHIYEFTASVSALGDVSKYEWAQSVGGIREGSVISLGDRIVGRFSYDSGIASTSNTGQWNPDPASTTYFYPEAASASNFFTFTILPSGQTISTGDTAPKRFMQLTDAQAGGNDSKDGLWISGGESYDLAPFGLSVTGRSTDWVANGRLPEHLSFSDMDNAMVYHNFNRNDGSRIMLSAKMTSLTNISVTAVPEPGTWAMLLAGLTILGVSARRKRG